MIDPKEPAMESARVREAVEDQPLFEPPRLAVIGSVEDLTGAGPGSTFPDNVEVATS
jgi:hypothetical protein